MESSDYIDLPGKFIGLKTVYGYYFTGSMGPHTGIDFYNMRSVGLIVDSSNCEDATTTATVADMTFTLGASSASTQDL